MESFNSLKGENKLKSLEKDRCSFLVNNCIESHVFVRSFVNIRKIIYFILIQSKVSSL